MASIVEHHAEWLSLLEINGPFLSLKTLKEQLPTGLDPHDAEVSATLRIAYEDWLANGDDVVLHNAWIEHILGTVLTYAYEADLLLSFSEIHTQSVTTDATTDVTTEQDKWNLRTLAVDGVGGARLQPDYVLRCEDGSTAPHHLLICTYAQGVRLESRQQQNASPVSQMVELLRATNQPLGLVTNGEEWMLIHALAGETVGYISWYAHLWLEEPLTLRAFRTLLGLERFFNVPDDQLLTALLAASTNEQHDITDQLGYQVRQAMEILVQKIAEIDQQQQGALLADVPDEQLYEAALVVMMRLVFLLSAEARDLLLLGDPLYDQHYAVSTLRGQLRAAADQVGEEIIQRRTDAWSRLLATFRAVHGGIWHPDLPLPAYGGDLFDPKRFPFLEGIKREKGAALQAQKHVSLPVDNRTVLHLLDALQLVAVKEGKMTAMRTVSFRALDIEQIGFIYQGLLDHKAVRATETVLGLTGSKDKEPEIALDALEGLGTGDWGLGDGEQGSGTEAEAPIPEPLLKFLKDQTGRTKNVLNKALIAEPDPTRLQRLQAVCGNDPALVERVKPWLNLLREDSRGYPIVILPGAVYVTAGTTRRATGTHYTPSSLSEPLVRHTLEPLVYIGPAEGKPQTDWTLRKPAEILDLKICDMAMGSGALLVQTCRYLADRLIESVQEHPKEANVQPLLPLLAQRQGEGGGEVTPDDALTYARRLIASRCLYGVDKNPLAVEMAKLSLWLVTLDKGKPFTFLDHAFRSGDSLIGVDLDQLRAWSLDVPKDAARQQQFGTIGLDLDIQSMIDLRREIEQMPVETVADQESKRHKLAEAEAIAHDLTAAADDLVASYYNTLKKKEQATLREALLQMRQNSASIEDKWLAHTNLGDLTPFHWPLEFPEVFLAVGREGFDGFIGNPPFQYGTLATAEHSKQYMEIARKLEPPWNGKADLIVGFFKRAARNVKKRGYISFLSTASLLRGETLDSGLLDLMNRGFIIYQAKGPFKWPGVANVNVIDISLCLYWKGNVTLNGMPVSQINQFLEATSFMQKPQILINSPTGRLGVKLAPANKEIAFSTYKQACQRHHLVSSIFEKTLGGSELYGLHDFNDAPRSVDPNKLVDLKENDLEILESIDERFAKPSKLKHSAPAKQLMKELPNTRLAFACAETSSVHLCFIQVPQKNIILKHKLIVFPIDRWETFLILQSSFHDSWAWQWGLRRKADLVYSPKRCAVTFPLPLKAPDDCGSSSNSYLDQLGQTYHEHRRQLMFDRQEGLTKTYNRFHNAAESAGDIVRLRELHVEMDQAVAAAYGWQDLALEHDFHETAQGIRYTISDAARREVLGRLLALNHERYAEEVAAGLHEKKGKKKKAKAEAKAEGKAKTREDSGQLGLFGG